MIKRIILLGKPGAGKGTLSQALVNEYKDLHHISTGDIFRNEIKNRSKLGQEVESILKKGDYVPDEITNQILKAAISNVDFFILDGYPRTINQAKFLDDIVKIDHVVQLQVEDNILVKRLSGRLVCQNGKHIYNLLLNKPKIENVCDIDNSPLLRRKDDFPNAIKERLNIFNEKTKPLIDYYQKQGKIIKIDANLEDIQGLIKIFKEKVF